MGTTEPTSRSDGRVPATLVGLLLIGGALLGRAHGVLPRTAAPPAAPPAAPLAVPAPPPAEDVPRRFVAAHGNDHDPGTRDEPFRQIQRAADTAPPGTVVHVGPGAYDPVVNHRPGLTFVSDEPWAATVDQAGTDPAWLNLADDVAIVGFALSAPRAHHGVNNRGSHVRIADNRVHDVFTSGTCTGGAAINHELYTGIGNAAIGNVVHGVGPVGCHLVHGIYVSNAHATVQRNVVHDVSGWLLHFYHGTDAGTVTDNVLTAGPGERAAGAEGGIVLCADEGNDRPADNFAVARNVIHDLPVGISECGRLGRNVGRNNRFVDNVIVNARIPTSTRNAVTGTRTDADASAVARRGTARLPAG